MSYHYKEATIFLQTIWPTWDTETLNNVIVHELVHSKLNQLKVVSVEAEKAFSEESYCLFESRFRHELEDTTEEITQVILDAYSDELIEGADAK